jgi:hypothetical protein
LCLELNKEQSPVAPLADDILKAMKVWVTRQFREMGCNKPEPLGVRFIVTLQGASMVANALHKPGIVSQQFDWLRSWVQSIN